jgi:hypothetical protein
MSNNEQTIQFPVALKPLLTDFVVNVLREQVPSDKLSSYAAQYFSERQNIQPSLSTNDDNNKEQTGVFLTNQSNGISQKSEDSINDEKQRRKTVWDSSPV